MFVSISDDLNLKDLDAENACPACTRGDMPTGAHLCMVCGKAVHACFPECSLPAPGSEDSEGYGQMRVCVTCSKGNLTASQNSFTFPVGQ